MIEGYSSFMVEMVREKLGYSADDDSHDTEVLAYLTGGEKISKSKHLPLTTKEMIAERENSKSDC